MTTLSPIPESSEPDIAATSSQVLESGDHSQRDDDSSIISIVTVSSSSDTNHTPPSTPNTSVVGSLSPSSSSFGGDVQAGKNSTREAAVVSDPSQWIFDPNYSPDDVVHVGGQLASATIEALVENLTPADGIVDPVFSAAFFLTFRLFSSPSELAETVDARYNIQPPPQSSEMEAFLWQDQKGSAVRTGALEFAHAWLNDYWQPGVDDASFPALTRLTSRCLNDDTSSFTRQSLTYPVMNLLNLRIQGELKTPGTKILPKPHANDASTNETPKRRITRALLTSLENKDFTGISFFDFDALEIARQLTLMESELYCAISQDDLLHYGQRSSKSIDAFESFGATIRHWVTESILHDLNIKRRAWLIKFFIKIADSCLKLNNFSTSRSILSILDSPVISRLRLALAALSDEQKAQLDHLKEFYTYREFRSSVSDEGTPAVPFLGLYLSSITFHRDCYQSYRIKPSDPSKKLIHLGKHYKLAEVLEDFRRFQVPYDLKPISGLQFYLREVAFKVARHLENTQILGERTNQAEALIIESVWDRKRAFLKQLQIWTSSSPSLAKDPDTETTPTESTTFASFVNRLPLTQVPGPSSMPSHQSISSNYSSSVGTIYSNPHSSIGTLDYGLFYTRRALSQDSEAMAGWWNQTSANSESYL